MPTYCIVGSIGVQIFKDKRFMGGVRWYIVVAVMVVALFSAAAHSKEVQKRQCGDFSAEVVPQKLSETCLYDDIGQYLVSDQLTEFTPNYPLWTDGANKMRWVYLPPGQKIDTSDPNRWVFPKGTLFFKEFSKTIPKNFYSMKQVKAETRLLAKVREGSGQDAWLTLAYAWDEDQKDAVLSEGYENVLGTNHDIPTKKQCGECHRGNKDMILGFDALQLSTARAWGNINTIPPQKKVWNLDLLQQAGLLTHPFKEQPAIPGPIIAKNALGYMHGNCGHCHNPLGKAFKEDVKHMVLRHDVTVEQLEETQVYKTAVNQKTRNFTKVPYIAKGAQDDELAIYQSAILVRMNSLLPKNRMPQLATKEIDYAGVDAVHKWLQTLPTPDDLDLDAGPGKGPSGPAATVTGEHTQGLRGKFSFLLPRAVPKVAIVYLPEDESLKSQPIVDHYDGDFIKNLVVGAPGEDIVLKNSDEIGHTIYAEDEGKQRWSIDYMPANSSTVRKIDWAEGEFVELKCKIHSYMRSWAGAIKSKYYKIIEFNEHQEAGFDLKSFPAEFSQVKIWIPEYDPVTVTLKPGEKISIDLIRKGQVRGTLELDRK